PSMMVPLRTMASNTRNVHFQRELGGRNRPVAQDPMASTGRTSKQPGFAGNRAAEWRTKGGYCGSSSESDSDGLSSEAPSSADFSPSESSLAASGLSSSASSSAGPPPGLPAGPPGGPPAPMPGIIGGAVLFAVGTACTLTGSSGTTRCDCTNRTSAGPLSV